MDEYLDKLTSLIDIKDIDYIIVDHTEPDHAGSAAKLVEMNPAIKLVGTATAISFMKEVHSDKYFPVSGEIVPIFSREEITGMALSARNICLLYTSRCV